MKRPLSVHALFVFILFSCLACEKTKFEIHESHSFIEEYYDIKGIVLQPVYAENGVSVEICGIAKLAPISGTPLPEDDDTGYYRKTVVPVYHAEERFIPYPCVCGTRFVDCSVRCGTRFDMAHPAGSPIDDIVYFASASPVKFIRSGYNDTFDWERNGMSLSDEYKKTGFAQLTSVPVVQREDTDEIRKGFHPICGVLADLDEDSFDIIGTGNSFSPVLAIIRFLERPENTSEPLKITVTFRDRDGEEYSASTEISF